MTTNYSKLFKINIIQIVILEGLLGWPLGFVELCWALCHFRFVAIPCDVGGICARYALHT